MAAMRDFSRIFANSQLYLTINMKYLGKPKYDSILLGTLLGLFAPLVVFLGYYLIAYHGMYLPAFFHYLSNGEIFIPVISLCATINLLIFFIFIWTNRDKSARGVLQATFVYAIYVCIMKLT
jgi:hypothetical protein